MSKQFNIFIICFLLVMMLSCTTENRKSYWENGNVKSELRYKDDKLNGKAVWYYENGHKEQEVFYEDNVLNGPLKRWYSNGKLETESFYKEGLLECPSLTYASN